MAIASIFLVFNSSFAPPQESHAVPVELVTLARQTNVEAAAPPPDQPVKPDLAPLPAPPMPEIKAEPAPDIQPPKFEIRKEKPPDTRQDISNLLNQLTRPEKPAKSNAPAATQSAGPATAMTSTLIDAFLSQIRNCWSPIAGAPNPADQIVSFDLRLNPDGTVAALTLLEASRTPYGSAAAQAGSRAIYQCQPYRLPPERYKDWREINPLRFDPRRMMQQ
ncbi:MAG: hypothetical protein JO256_03480 [Alphaproteobacteria bacterium]|nr:hypothetical protein [Alphaproteobacteria bacterium]